MKKICIHCESEFDLHDKRKIKAGGKINECADCIEELGGDISPPRYLGVAAGNGKMSDVTVLKFKDEKSREIYAKSWKNNSGQNKGKSCQLGRHLTSMTGMKFEIVAENRGNDNHKGHQ